MVLTLEDMDFEIEASHHEVAPAQHEIDFKYDEALKTADNIQTFLEHLRMWLLQQASLKRLWITELCLMALRLKVL